MDWLAGVRTDVALRADDVTADPGEAGTQQVSGDATRFWGAHVGAAACPSVRFGRDPVDGAGTPGERSGRWRAAVVGASTARGPGAAHPARTASAVRRARRGTRGAGLVRRHPDTVRPARVSVGWQGRPARRPALHHPGHGQVVHLPAVRGPAVHGADPAACGRGVRAVGGRLGRCPGQHLSVHDAPRPAPARCPGSLGGGGGRGRQRHRARARGPAPGPAPPARGGHGAHPGTAAGTGLAHPLSGPDQPDPAGADPARRPAGRGRPGRGPRRGPGCGDQAHPGDRGGPVPAGAPDPGRGRRHRHLRRGLVAGRRAGPAGVQALLDPAVLRHQPARRDVRQQPVTVRRGRPPGRPRRPGGRLVPAGPARPRRCRTGDRRAPGPAPGLARRRRGDRRHRTAGLADLLVTPLGLGAAGPGRGRAWGHPGSPARRRRRVRAVRRGAALVDPGPGRPG